MMSRDSLIGDFFVDPYGTYQQMRSAPPVLINSDADLNTSGLWIFSKYEDVKQIFQLAGSVSKNIALARRSSSASVFDMNMLNMDGQDHVKSRYLVREFFSNKYLQEISSAIELAAVECLSDVANKPIINLVDDYAEIIPLKAILRVLGLPTNDAAQVRMWSLAISPSLDSFQEQSPIMRDTRTKVVKEISGYIRAHMKQPQALPDGTLLKHLCMQCATGGVEENHAIGAAILLLFAGHETTISLIGTSLYLLLSHPEQWDRVCRDASLIPAAIEEVLRFESPAQRSTFRVAVSPVSVGGQLVEPGQQLVALLGSANRDERVFEKPDQFDIDRKNIRHFSFGAGAHVCLGQLLARMEAKISLEKISKIMPSLRLSSPTPLWRKNSFFRQLQTLPATWC